MQPDSSTKPPKHVQEYRQQRLILFACAATLRLCLAAAFPALPGFLSNRVELSTPVTSFTRLREGLFLHDHGLSPYDGGVFHQSPLLLALFSCIPDIAKSPLSSVAIYTVLDILGADALMRIAGSGAASKSRTFQSPREERGWSPIATAGSYLFNPLTVLTCLARPTSVFSTTFVLLASSKACSGEMLGSAFALALAAYNSLHPALLLPPMVLLCFDRRKGQPAEKSSDPSRPSQLVFALRYTLAFTVSIAVLIGLSFVLTNSWSFIPAVYGTRLTLPDLTPNVGLWWYFFIEMFDSFRSFFLGVFWLHMVAYSPGLTIRLRRQPLAVVVLLCGIFSIFQPYANAGDAGAWLAMLTLFGHVFELTRYMFPALSSLLYSLCLAPAFYYLWIYAGSGNANFFYAITLVWSLGCVVILADVLYAILRDEWELERPEMKGIDAVQI